MNYDMSQYICLDDANNNNADAENDDDAENNVPREAPIYFQLAQLNSTI